MTLIHYIIDIILSKYDITQIHLYLNFLDPTSLWLVASMQSRDWRHQVQVRLDLWFLSLNKQLSLYIRQPFGPRHGEITVIQFLV